MKVTHRSKLYRNGTDELKQIITAMAFPRDIWITKFRQRFEGTLKEYTKIHLVEKLELKNYWNKEVTVLAKRVSVCSIPKLLNAKVIGISIKQQQKVSWRLLGNRLNAKKR